MSFRALSGADAETRSESDAFENINDHIGFRQRTSERTLEATDSHNVLLFLIAFRILNALSIKTFFQPDEYFQSLEPAWQIAFGPDSGAWITWVGNCPPCQASVLTMCYRNGNTNCDPQSIPRYSPPSTGSHPAYLAH